MNKYNLRVETKQTISPLYTDNNVYPSNIGNKWSYVRGKWEKRSRLTYWW